MSTLKRIALTLLAAALPCLGWAADTYTWNLENNRFEDAGGEAFTFPAGFTGAFTLSANFTMPNVSSATGDILVFNATKVSDSTSVGGIGLRGWSGHVIGYVAGSEAATNSGGHYSNARLYNSGNGTNTLSVSVSNFASGTAGTATFGFTFANEQTKDEYVFRQVKFMEKVTPRKKSRKRY